MFKGIFVDDRKDEAYLAEKISAHSAPDLNVEFMEPISDLIKQSDNMIDASYDLVMLDFRLDETREEGKESSRYKASALAQCLRDRFVEEPEKDMPIIIVSAEDKIHRFFEPDFTSHDLFDRVFAKKCIVDNIEDCVKEIMSLISAYKLIISTPINDERLSNLLGLESDEVQYSDVQALRELCSTNIPHKISRIIFTAVIDQQGLLLDQDNLLANLGVSRDSADIDKLKEKILESKVRYEGIFSDGWPRWWRHRLKRFGEAICGDSLGNLTSSERVAWLNKAFSLSLSPAVSPWTGKDSLTAFACASCRRPSEIDYSVAAYDPTPYRFVETKRICWDCIQKGTYKEKRPGEKELKIDEAEVFIVDKIENGKISR